MGYFRNLFSSGLPKLDPATMNGVASTQKETTRTVDLRAMGFNYGSPSPLLQNIYQDVGPMTPQKRMWFVRKMLNNMSWVLMSVQHRANLLIGGEVTIDTKDRSFKAFFEEEYFPYTNILKVAREVALHYCSYGNSYVEKSRAHDGRIGKLFVIPTPDQIFIDVQMGTGKILRYVQQVMPYFMEGSGFDRVTIHYSNGMYADITGIPILPRDIHHFKQSQDDLPEYGRSPLLASINDYQILKEWERGGAVDMKLRSTNRNYIIKKEGTPEDPILFKEQMELFDDQEDVFITGDIDVKPMNQQRGVIMSPIMLKYYQQKLTTPSLPNFLADGENTNRATAHVQWKAWQMSLNAERHDLIYNFNKVWESIWISQGNKTVPEFTTKLGDLDTPSPDEYRDNVEKMWLNSGLTHEEYRVAMGWEVDPDRAEFYYDDIVGGGEYAPEDEGEEEEEETQAVQS